MDKYTDVRENVRSRLMSTALLAAASVVLLAAGGTIAASEAWFPAVQVAVGVAAGSVLVSLAALGRAYVIFRIVRPMPIAAGPTSEVVDRGGPVAAKRTAPDTPSAPDTMPAPPPVTPRTNRAELDTTVRSGGPELKREVFGKLAYRLQSLVNRLIYRIDQIEQEVEDPELLKAIYGIDHLATRIRRQIENLAVLGGEAPQRRSNVPVDVNALLRASIAEIEHYTQVSAVPIHDAKIHGNAVAEIIHLLAELLENATTFTTPGAPKVMLRAHRVAAGLAIQVQDRGIGMPLDDISQLNRLLDGSTQVDVGKLLQDGRIGLAVVEILARRHNIGAELQRNIFGGTDASIVIPHELLSGPDAQGQSPREMLSHQGVLRPTAPVATSEGGAPSPMPAPMPLAAVSDTSGPPSQPRHAAQAPVQPQGGQHGSFPLAAPVAYPTAAPVAIGGDGDRVPDAGADVRKRDQRQGGEEGPSDALPRRRRGESYERLRSTVVEDVGGGVDVFDTRRAAQATPTPPDNQPPADRSNRPALPQRRGSHMREELRDPPELMRPIPGHDPTLLAALLEGRARGREEPEQSEGLSSDAPQPHHAHDWNR
jgi:signal transduction histidine kinase